jgi:hypothetical protein
MEIKPGLIGDGRKTIFGGSAISNCAKSCALQLLCLANGKTIFIAGTENNAMRAIR